MMDTLSSSVLWIDAPNRPEEKNDDVSGDWMRSTYFFDTVVNWTSTSTGIRSIW